MKVTLHRSGSMGLLGVVTLKQGDNEVAAEDWAKVAEHPVVKESLRKGRAGGLTVEQTLGQVSPEPVPAPVEPEPLDDETTPSTAPPSPDGERLLARDTIELVRRMSLIELESLEEDEDRKTVLEAIEKRRSELLGDEG